MDEVCTSRMTIWMTKLYLIFVTFLPLKNISCHIWSRITAVLHKCVWQYKVVAHSLCQWRFAPWVGDWYQLILDTVGVRGLQIRLRSLLRALDFLVRNVRTFCAYPYLWSWISHLLLRQYTRTSAFIRNRNSVFCGQVWDPGFGDWVWKNWWKASKLLANLV